MISPSGIQGQSPWPSETISKPRLIFYSLHLAAFQQHIPAGRTGKHSYIHAGGPGLEQALDCGVQGSTGSHDVVKEQNILTIHTGFGLENIAGILSAGEAG